MTQDKTKSRAIFILEIVLDRIATDAAATFPLTGSAYDVIKWAETFKLLTIEAVRRKDVPFQPKYRNLPIEEKAKVILEKAHFRVEEILKKQERKAEADACLAMELPPAPQPPQSGEEPDETPAPPEKKGQEESDKQR